MLWKDRLMSAVLAILVTAAAGAALWRFAPEKPRFTPGQLLSGITYEATGVPSDEIVYSIDGNGAEAELFTFWLGAEFRQIEGSFGIDIPSNWDMPIDADHTLSDYLREDALMALRQELVLENICAANGVTLSEEDEAALAAERESVIEQYGGYENYLAELYQLGISDAGYRRISRTDYLYAALYQAYHTPGNTLCPSDDVLHAYAAGAGWISADHILLMTVDPATYAPLDSEAIAARRAQAEDILAQLRASDDPIALFDELADQYGEDPGRAANPNGYTFPQGTMVEEFDTAARALDEGEISDIVETQYGFHIILRRPLNVTEAVDSVRDEYFDAFLLGEIERAEPEESPSLERLDLVTLYDALRGAREQSADADAPAGP